MRRGERKKALLMAIAALVMFANATTLPMLYLVGALLGFSALGTTTSMKIFVSQWFAEGQGVAVGIAFIGLSSAGVVVPSRSQRSPSSRMVRMPPRTAASSAERLLERSDPRTGTWVGCPSAPVNCQRASPCTVL